MRFSTTYIVNCNKSNESDKENICKNGYNFRRMFRNSNQIRLGLFVFKPEISIDQIKTLVPQKSLRLINVNPAYRYCKTQMFMVRLWLEYCTQWDHGILELGSHGYKTFFHQFQNISLKQLLVLNIENNNITSLEMIQNLDAPNLDCLYMHGNPIVSVKSLRKANFPKLTRIYINAADNETLSELHAPNLQIIQNLPRTVQSFDWKKCNSISWIAKIESSKLRRVIVGMKKLPKFSNQIAQTSLMNKNKDLKIM